ncbi:MAG TPA: EamA family transporter [Mycobacteriales bacterium]|nr:EamA family transporter [Mycobacteriales bacterium]
MLAVQLGAALSIDLFPVVGPAGTAWLRLCFAALVLLALVRPRLRELSRRSVGAAASLGAVSAVMTVAYFESIARLPLGTAVALEFLGPLAVAVLRRGSSRTALLWPALALFGVLALTEPWTGAADPLGVAFALTAAAGWAGYILLTQRVGDALPGLTGLALSMPVAAACAAVVGAPQAVGHLSPAVLAEAAALALLLPLLPYALEMQALRRLTAAAFGTIAALEPALAVLVGVLVLGQVPHAWQAAGVVLVMVAGLGAERSGARRPAGPAGT